MRVQRLIITVVKSWQLHHPERNSSVNIGKTTGFNRNLQWHFHSGSSSTVFQIELEFRRVDFCGGRKTREPGEKPSEQGWEPTTNWLSRTNNKLSYLCHLYHLLCFCLWQTYLEYVNLLFLLSSVYYICVEDLRGIK